jgi:hypothetical protein
MMIKRMCAAFGKLEQATLELKEGLNIIEAPNETGKSTWAAFLRAMLYGINTRERDRKNTIAEKNLYQPWSGTPMEGSIDLVWQGREITLRRFRKGNTPFAGFEAVYTASGTPVPGLTGENAGELLLGVGREVYERSAFVGQSALLIDQTAELESRIAALASSGQEDVSFSLTQKRLKEWQNRRKHNKTGLIPQMEQELSASTDTIQRIEETMTQTAAARSELALRKQQEAELKKEQAAHKKIANDEAWQRYQTIKQELDRTKDAFMTVETEAQRYGVAPEAAILRNGQANLNYLATLDSNIKLARRQQVEASETTAAAIETGRDEVFSNYTADDAWKKATADAEAITTALNTAQKTPPAANALLVLGLIFGAALGVTGYYLLPAMKLPFIGGGAGLFVLFACITIPVRSRWKNSHNANAQAILSGYPSANTTDDILRRAAMYRETYAAILSAKEQESRVTQALQEMEQEREQLFQSLLDLVHPFAPTVTDVFGISAALSRSLTLDDRSKTARREYESALRIWEAITTDGTPESPTGDVSLIPTRTAQETEDLLTSNSAEALRLQRTLDMAQGELRSLGDLSALRAQQDELRDKLKARTHEYEAISLALDALSSAHYRLEERFSPILNQKTGEILAAFTDNKYTSVSLNRDLDAHAIEAGELLPRRALTLSTGTIDQLYLAVRLAVCDITLPADDPAPLVLDDALASFDDLRMGLALEYLCRLPRQVLLFTCHHREATYFTDASDISIISLQTGLK